MAALHLLGTGSAVTDAHRTTTMLALEDEGRSFLVDCGGDVYQRALLAGIDPEGIDGLIITHEHPDHVSGFVLLMLRLWQTGRTRALPVFGIPSALSQAQRLLDAFHTDNWQLPQIQWIGIDETEGAALSMSGGFDITASPGAHGVPVIGLRFAHRATNYSIVYSCDTEPCDSITRLAEGADLLIHDATGEGPGHSSAAQAVGVAREAGCDRLVLIHLPVGLDREDLNRLDTSGLEVVIGEELDRFEF